MEPWSTMDEMMSCHMSSRGQADMVELLVVLVKAEYYVIEKLSAASLAWVLLAKCHSSAVSCRQD
jgi:hypothetical protein